MRPDLHKELIAVIEELAEHLPDGAPKGYEDQWGWCWDQLTDGQEKVKEVRKRANDALEELRLEQ